MQPAERRGRPVRTFLGGEVDRRCCVELVLGIIAGLIIEYFIMGLRFKAFPPECIIIDQGMIGRGTVSGMIIVTNKTATIRSYVNTLGLKVEYKDVSAVVTLGEARQTAQEITPRIRLGDVNLGYARFHMWPINFTGDEVSVKPFTDPSKSNFILKMEMKMKWFSFWSVRPGTFNNVKILCPLKPERINVPVACVSLS